MTTTTTAVSGATDMLPEPLDHADVAGDEGEEELQDLVGNPQTSGSDLNLGAKISTPTPTNRPTGRNWPGQGVHIARPNFFETLMIHTHRLYTRPRRAARRVGVDAICVLTLNVRAMQWEGEYGPDVEILAPSGNLERGIPAHVPSFGATGPGPPWDRQPRLKRSCGDLRGASNRI